MKKILFILAMIAISVCGCSDDEAMRKCQETHSYDVCHHTLYRQGGCHMKYIIFDNFFPVIFPDTIEHKAVADGINKTPTSAGFIEHGKCTGFSDSLGIGAGEKDTMHIKMMLKFIADRQFNPVEQTK